jgi:alpha-glucosidase
MRREIRDIERVQHTDAEVRLIGVGGELRLRCLTGSAFLVEYRIEGVPGVQPSYPYVWPGLRQAAADSFDRIDDSDASVTVVKKDISIVVEKRTATVSFFRCGVRVFGGAVGHSETVLPPYPLRVQDSLTTGEGKGRTGKFNFNLEADDIVLGLGEKSGGIVKNRRRFRMFNRDALGYDASSSDPLYISVPFFMQLNRERSTVAGVFFPTTAVEEIDFGVESNYYTAVSLSGAPYSYVVFTGEGYRDILRGYYGITGFPALPPRFHFGFFGSSMSYTEPENAEQRVSDFFAQTEAEGIPCEGMYFSSGYVKSKTGQRYTFLWNQEKFPDPSAFIGKLRSRGYRVICNIKPGILNSHPWYQDLAERGYFIPSEDGSPLEEYYWGGIASLVDFSNPQARSWWQNQVRHRFIEYGVEGIWNDNNEFEIEDEGSARFGDHKLLPVMMAEATYEALLEARPDRRPWIVSRSGYAGLQRFASTWTGDNVSDDVSLLWNIPMGMNMGLSGLPFYGHDIGGFYGPAPSSDLLSRWCQSAVFQPRFVIHSWNPDGVPTEPWLYPSILVDLVALIRLRYYLLPYLYSVALSTALTGVPMERPAWIESFPSTRYGTESLEHLVGDDLFVVPPREIGAHEVSWAFPSGASWVSADFRSRYAGGLPGRQFYPRSTPLFFYRSGSAVPVREPRDRIPEGYYDELVLLLVPPAEGEDAAESIVYEDDGSRLVGIGSYCAYSVRQAWEEGGVHCTVTVKAFARDAPQSRRIRLVLPEGYRFDSNPSEGGDERSFLSTFSAVGDRMEVILVRISGP